LSGKKFLELAVELGGQRLVGRQDQRRALGLLDHLGHGEGLARAGDAEQHLVALGLGGRFPRLLAVLAGRRADLAVFRLAPRLDRVKLGLLRQVRGPVGNRTGRGHRRTRKLRLRRLLETIEFGTIGTGVFCRGFGHGGNMGRVCGEGKRPEEQKENKNGPY
jgi:hypothetical protein